MSELNFISEEKKNTVATYLSELSKISKNIDALSIGKLYITVDSETPSEDEMFAGYVDISLLGDGTVEIEKILEIIDAIYGEDFIGDRLYYRIESFEGSNICSDWYYINSEE